MKVKTNLRAGSGSANSGGVNGGHSSSTDSSSINNTVVSYVPPVTTTRCVGI